MSPAVILSTYPSKEAAAETADRLVRLRVAACANILEVSSVYAWQGGVERESEALVIFKTTQESKDALKRSIEETHPYQIPEIVEIGVSSVNLPYLEWLADSTS